MATWAYPLLPAEQINREADTALVCKTYMDPFSRRSLHGALMGCSYDP